MRPRKILLIIALMTLTASAQTKQDVVYLKDGNIIRGTIVEQIPRTSIKIQTADGKICIYKMEEVEKYVQAPLLGVDRGTRVGGRKRITIKKTSKNTGRVKKLFTEERTTVKEEKKAKRNSYVQRKKKADNLSKANKYDHYDW